MESWCSHCPVKWSLFWPKWKQPAELNNHLSSSLALPKLPTPFTAPRHYHILHAQTPNTNLTSIHQGVPSYAKQRHRQAPSRLHCDCRAVSQLRDVSILRNGSESLKKIKYRKIFKKKKKNKLEEISRIPFETDSHKYSSFFLPPPPPHPPSCHLQCENELGKINSWYSYAELDSEEEEGGKKSTF